MTLGTINRLRYFHRQAVRCVRCVHAACPIRDGSAKLFAIVNRYNAMIPVGHFCDREREASAPLAVALPPAPARAGVAAALRRCFSPERLPEEFRALLRRLS